MEVGNVRMIIMTTLLMLVAALVNAGSRPFLVADLATEATSTGNRYDTYISDLYEASDGVVYFSAPDGVHGHELWRTDGTPSGTWLVSDIYPGLTGSSVQLQTDDQGQLIFTATEVPGCSNPSRLWRSDGSHHGTAPGPTLIGHSTCPSISFPPWPVLDVVAASDGRLFFAQWTRELGEEVWIIDSPSEEPRVIDLCQGSCDSRPSGWVALGERVLFLTSEGNEKELWVSDGTEGGTRKLSTISGEWYEASLLKGTLLGDSYLFSGNTGLWQTDGTSSGTRKIYDLGQQRLANTVFTPVGEVVFFGGADQNNRAQVWMTDGTSHGTTLIEQLALPFVGYPGFARSGGSVLFTLATGGHQDPVQLWCSDGTSLGTMMLVELDHIWGMKSLQSSVVLIARQGPVTGIWTSDGTSSGTYLIRELGSKHGHGMSSLGESAIFFTTEGEYGEPLELWHTDGTAAGTELVQVINAADRSSSPDNLIPFQESVIFNAGARPGSPGLWLSDGSPEGTRLIAPELDIEEHATIGDKLFLLVSDSSSLQMQLLVLESDAEEPQQLAQFRWGGELEVVGESLYLNVQDDSGGLWRSDGTPQGTGLVNDQLEGIFNLSRFGQDLFLIGLVGDVVSLFRSDGEQMVKIADLSRSQARSEIAATEHGLCYINHSTTLWSGGTAEETKFLDAPFDNGYLFSLTPAGETMYVLSFSNRGNELWKLSEAGFSLIHDLRDAGQAGSATELVAAGSRVFFGLFHEATGYELWVSDGTTEGTTMVRDIYPGPRGSIPSGLAYINDTLVFAADDGVNGHELWINDGSPSGTRLVADLAPGRRAASPQMFAQAGSLVFFSADDGTSGRELWAIPQATLTGRDLTTRRPRGRRNF
jgi:ELWxxDGT repeat protein